MRYLKSLRKKLSLPVSLVLFVFGVMLATVVVVGAIAFGLHRIGLLDWASTPRSNPLMPLFGFFLICVILGTALTGFLSRKALLPIRKVIDATHRVAQGDFTVQVELKGIGELEELSQSFNKMTHELSSIETLRSDFINTFSHEFKTPIVSVRGFAKLVRDGDLSEAERREYLDIIVTESERLASLSTNVLNLSKYENIEILPDKSPLRLDEQIRRVIALTEPKWSAKELVMNVQMEEITFVGNADLLQQVWLNLMDNAVKFSQAGGEVTIRLFHWNGNICFTIQDGGAGMDAETKERVFDKFYQGDSSHAKAGNGLGLAIVKRIAELHGGMVQAESESGKGSLFTVTLEAVQPV